MEVDLPFKAEYAKSGRAGCKGCKSNIEKGSLRIAAMVQVSTNILIIPFSITLFNY